MTYGNAASDTYLSDWSINSKNQWNQLMYYYGLYGTSIFGSSMSSDHWVAIAVLFHNEGGRMVDFREYGLVFTGKVNTANNRFIYSKISKVPTWEYFYYKGWIIPSSGKPYGKKAYSGLGGNNSLPGFEGDAFVFRGGGFCQVTTKDNYVAAFSVMKKLPLLPVHAGLLLFDPLKPHDFSEAMWIMINLCYLAGCQTRKQVYDRVHSDFTVNRMQCKVFI